ncbi:MAG: DUF2905 domain-containing protein [Spirochaetota bacterium]
MARILITAGILLTLAGVLLYFFPGMFRMFGNLPGDIRIERENVTVYIPITTMVLVSILLTLIAGLFRL